MEIGNIVIGIINCAILIAVTASFLIYNIFSTISMGSTKTPQAQNGLSYENGGVMLLLYIAAIGLVPGAIAGYIVKNPKVGILIALIGSVLGLLAPMSYATGMARSVNATEVQALAGFFSKQLFLGLANNILQNEMAISFAPIIIISAVIGGYIGGSLGKDSENIKNARYQAEHEKAKSEYVL